MSREEKARKVRNAILKIVKDDGLLSPKELSLNFITTLQFVQSTLQIVKSLITN